MSYQPPLQDLMFCIENLSHWDKVCGLELYSEFNLSDIGATLEAYAQFCGEQNAQLSHIGDALDWMLENGRRDIYAAFPE